MWALFVCSIKRAYSNMLRPLIYIEWSVLGSQNPCETQKHALEDFVENFCPTINFCRNSSREDSAFLVCLAEFETHIVRQKKKKTSFSLLSVYASCMQINCYNKHSSNLTAGGIKRCLLLRTLILIKRRC